MRVKAGTAYVDIEGDLGPLNKSIDNATKTSKSKFAGIGKAAAAGMAIGVGAIGIVAKASIDAAVESEKSQAKLRTQLKNMGVSYSEAAPKIDAIIQKQSSLFAVDDED